MPALTQTTTGLPSLGLVPRRASARPRNDLAFVVFLLVNAVLFVRPGEVVPGLIGWPIYKCLILLCLALAIKPVLVQLAPSSLAVRPVTISVLALLPLIVLSQLGNGNVFPALEALDEFGKVVIYYLLLVALLATPERLRRFLFWLALFSVTTLLLTLLNYHHVLTLPNLTVLQDRSRDQLTGRDVVFARLRGSGIFNDPNELCLLLVFGIALCLYWAGERRHGGLRFLWLIPVGLFAYALSLTQSRGGFLALTVGMLVFFLARFGRARTIGLGLLALPVLFVLFAGRQTSVSVGEATAHERIELWSDALAMLRRAPLFGVGYGNFDSKAGHVAHNSFLHAYAELGFLAGTLFLGSFYYCFRELSRVGGPRRAVLDPDMQRLRPYLLAGAAGYATGMISLSYAYAVPTYTILGLVTAYLHVTPVSPPVKRQGIGRWMVLFLGVSVLFLIVMYLFVKISK